MDTDVLLHIFPWTRVCQINGDKREMTITHELQERKTLLDDYALFIRTAFFSHTVFQITCRNSETS